MREFMVYFCLCEVKDLLAFTLSDWFPSKILPRYLWRIGIKILCQVRMRERSWMLIASKRNVLSTLSHQRLGIKDKQPSKWDWIHFESLFILALATLPKAYKPFLKDIPHRNVNCVCVVCAQRKCSTQKKHLHISLLNVRLLSHRCSHLHCKTFIR